MQSTSLSSEILTANDNWQFFLHQSKLSSMTAVTETPTSESLFIETDQSQLKQERFAFSNSYKNIQREGVFWPLPLPHLSMEPAANRTQADAFHAGLQAFLENVLVPDCLL